MGFKPSWSFELSSAEYKHVKSVLLKVLVFMYNFVIYMVAGCEFSECHVLRRLDQNWVWQVSARFYIDYKLRWVWLCTSQSINIQISRRILLFSRNKKFVFKLLPYSSFRNNSSVVGILPEKSTWMSWKKCLPLKLPYTGGSNWRDESSLKLFRKHKAFRFSV